MAEYVCENLRFLRDQMTEVGASRRAQYGLFIPDVEEHERNPETCTDDVLRRYSALYNNTGLVSDIWGFFDPDYLRTHNLKEEFEFHLKHSNYGQYPLRRQKP